MQQIAGPSFINDQSLNKSNPNWDQASCSYFVMFFIIISPLQFVTRYIVLSFIIDVPIIRCYPAQHKAPLEFIQGYQLACHLNQQQIWFLGKKPGFNLVIQLPLHPSHHMFTFSFFKTKLFIVTSYHCIIPSLMFGWFQCTRRKKSAPILTSQLFL